MNFVEEIHCNIFLPHSIRFDQSNGLIRSNSIIAHFGCLLSSRRYHPQIDSALNLQLFETIIQMNFVEEMNGNISLPHSFGFHQLIKRLNSIDFNQSRFRKSWIESAAAAPSADNKSILNEILKPWKQSGT